MKFLPFSFGVYLLVGGLSMAQEVHGPFCSWHLDPTSTMTIQWIEKVNAAVEPGEWHRGTAGFGYADGDDATQLQMQDEHKILYIRKGFELRALPTEETIRLFGRWDARGEVDGKEVLSELNFRYDFDSRRTTGTISVGDDEPVDLSKIDAAGSSVILEWPRELNGEKGTMVVDASAVESGKLEGKAKWVKSDGTNGVESTWVAELDPDSVPRFGRGGGRGRGDGGRGQRRGRGQGDSDEVEVELILRIRYDDAFIAYLNGTEIVRAGIESGNGAGATGIESHEARDEEEFVLDDEHVKLLKRGVNILAVEGHNDEIDSSDFSLHPELFVKVGNRDRERALVDDGADWQFLLGEPEPDWYSNLEDETHEIAPVPSNHTNFELRYGSRGGSLDLRGDVQALPFADTGNVLHRVILKGLDADTAYAFTVNEMESGVPLKGRKWFFRTAPDQLDKPFRFVSGGDMYDERNLLDAMNSQAGYEKPLFALLGGDLAYANGTDANRWYHWVDSWHENAVSQDDSLVPMIAVIGNHECAENLNDIFDDRRKVREFDPRKSAKFYFSLFPLPEDQTHFVIDFAEYMSIVCLDSFHTQTPESQVEWLEKTLKQRAGVPNLFACYHRPAFGTKVKDDIPEIRRHWVPLFEKYGVDVAFEHDHHVYKRSLPMLAGEVRQDGVIYMGDGAWGVKVRDIPWEKIRRLDYLVRAESENHFIRVILYSDRQQFDAIDEEGRPVDSYTRFRFDEKPPALSKR